MGIVMVGLVAVGAPEVRDAIVDDEVDAVLTNPGEYQLSEEGAVETRAVFQWSSTCGLRLARHANARCQILPQWTNCSVTR